jgi:hypothetical protein
MPYTLIMRPLAAALALSLASTAALAGGYGGGSSACSPVAPREAQAILTYADQYADGNFRVRHTESAGATASTNAHGETGSGYGSSDTEIQSDGGVTSWKRSVQHSSGHAENGSASATGFSASFVKVRTDDGKYYIFKGYASTGASAGPGGTSTSQSGLAKSVGGRY